MRQITRMLVRALTLAAALAACRAGPARAQLALPDVFRTESLLVLEREATERHRVLVVLLCDKRDEWLATIEASPTLRAWFHWHAEVKVVSIHEEEGMALAEWVRSAGCGTPCAMLFRPHGRSPKVITQPTPLQLLFHADFMLEQLESLEPVWFEWHQLKNPAPPPPPLALLAAADDGLGARITDADMPASPIAALAMAREQAQAGYEYDATGTYTWLWENLERGDPMLRPVRLLWLAEPVQRLVDADDGARERFVAVREALNQRLLWMDWHEWLDWMVAAHITGEHSGVVESLDSLLNEYSEDAIMPEFHRRAFEDLMRAMDRWSDPSRVMGDEIEFLRDRAAKLDQPAPPRATPEEWASVLRLRRDVLLTEGVRAHTVLLVAGREDDAFEAAELVLRALEAAPVLVGAADGDQAAGEAEGVAAPIETAPAAVHALAPAHARAARADLERAFLWSAACRDVLNPRHTAWVERQPEILRGMFDIRGPEAAMD